MKQFGLSNNQLKFIAMVTMAMDHIGIVLIPHVTWLRIAGRLAFPIYAFMIAEGCQHTRNMFRYFLSVFLMAVACQAVSYFVLGSLYMCILVTFSLSIFLIGLLKQAQKTNSFLWRILLLGGICGAFFLCRILPGMLPGTDFTIDYGFIGVMIPLCLYSAKEKSGKMTVLILVLTCLATIEGGLQWWSLLAAPLLLLYNGRRGKGNLKWFFYFFYPVHLAIIYGISLLM